MEITLIITTSIMNIACFFIGAKVGQKVVNRQELTISSPINKIKEQKALKEVKEEQLKEATILHNIDIYDGTSIGQVEISRTE